MKKYFIFIFLIPISLFFISCKKDNANDTPPIKDERAIITYNVNINPENLIQTFHFKERESVINYYGEIDTIGEITKVEAISIHKSSNTDTIYNFSFDDSVRVKSMFMTIRGVNDTTIFKLSYQDSLVVMSSYYINWSTGDVILRNNICFTRYNYNYISQTSRLFGLNGGLTLPRLALDAIIAFTGGYLLTAQATLVLGTVLGVPVAPFVGVGLLLYTLYDVTHPSLSMIQNLQNSIDAIFSNDANAAEIDILPNNIPNNPIQELDVINPSGIWRYRTAYVIADTKFETIQVDYWPETYGGVQDSVIAVDIKCDDGSVYPGFVCKGFYFYGPPEEILHVQWIYRSKCPDSSFIDIKHYYP